MNLEKAWKSLRVSLKKWVLYNLPWKLLSAFLAVCLWAFLITQDPTLTRERIFSDVPVTLQGSETLRRNGFILLTNFQATPPTVRLRADVPQREYNTVAAANYSPRIDLSKITETGKQTLKVATTSLTTYGTVREVVPDSIEIIVDDYTTNYRVPVVIERTGQYPKGFHGTAPSSDPSSVMVSGPKSIVDRIARVVVDFNVSNLPPQTGSVRSAVPMRFVDLNNEAVESDLIDVTNAGVLLRSIVVDQPLYATKTLPVSSATLTTGTPAAGFEVKSITATPNILVAAGDEIALGALDTLFLDKVVDVSGQSESFTTEVDLRQPSELVYLSSKSIMLSVEIGPIISARDFNHLSFTIQDRAEKRTVQTTLKDVAVTLTGPAPLLSSIKSSQLSAYVDISTLGAGTHELPILLNIQNADNQKFTYDITPKLVQLVIESD